MLLLKKMSDKEFSEKYYNLDKNIYAVNSLLKLYNIGLNDVFSVVSYNYNGTIIMASRYLTKIISVSENGHRIILQDVDINGIEKDLPYWVEPGWFLYRDIEKIK